MARRAVALGIGLVVLILLVFGAKGCLDARKNRSLEDYAGSVTQIVDETNSLSKSFFGRLEDPQDLGVPDFVSEIESDRSAMDGFLSRVEKLDTPGDMKSAQSTLLLTYQLRAGAMNTIAERMATAAPADAEGREAAIRQIARQMEVLAASDVLYNHVTRHQIDFTISDNGATAAAMPKSVFVPDVAEWVDAKQIESALGQVSGAGGTTSSTGTGTSGTQLDSAAIGAVTLDAAAPTTIPAGTDPAVIVSVTNGGETDLSDIEVSVSVDGGDPITSSIDALAAGEAGQATVALTPAPTGEVTLDVVVAAAEGEELLDNNEGSFQVIFE